MHLGDIFVSCLATLLLGTLLTTLFFALGDPPRRSYARLHVLQQQQPPTPPDPVKTGAVAKVYTDGPANFDMSLMAPARTAQQ